MTFRGVTLKFVSLIKADNSSNIDPAEDYKNSTRYAKLSLGKSFLFIKNLFKVYYIEYSEIDNYFRRVALIPTVSFKGKKQLPVEYLVIRNNGNELAQIQLPGKKAAVEICEKMQTLVPNSHFGKEEEDSQ